MLSELNNFFTPFDISKVNISTYINKEDLIYNNVSFYSKDDINTSSEQFDIAVIGVPEIRNSNEKGSDLAPDEIRKELYKLYCPSSIRIIDLGNLKPGKSVNDTYVALSEITYNLLKEEIVVILIGGSKDLIIPVCKAYEKGKKLFSLCAVEPRFSISDENDLISSESYLSEIIKKNKRFYNYSNLGYQSYYNSINNISYITDNFEAVRLGRARTELFHNEPYIRDSDIFCIDIKSVKRTDAPGVKNPSVNGFYSEEICQLAKYAGLSDRVSTFGLFNVNPEFDIDNHTVELSAQIIWHFIQSFYNRKKEYTTLVIKKFLKYIVNIESIGESLIFYKSTKTGRWWVEVNYVLKNKEKTKLISCNYEDYLIATRNDIPERWWKFFQRYN